MKKELPMLCASSVVKAIHEGRQAQDRRPVKPQPERFINCVNGIPQPIDGVFAAVTSSGTDVIIKPKHQIGDLVYVREAYFSGYKLDENDHITDEEIIIYRADTMDSRPADMSDFYCETVSGHDKKDWPKWTPFAPKSIARIWLEVINVRVERVQDISEDDAEAEGIEIVDHNCYRNYMVDKDWAYDGKNQRNYHMLENPIGSFASLWQSLYPGSWERNDYVFVYDFKVLSTTGRPAL